MPTWHQRNSFKNEILIETVTPSHKTLKSANGYLHSVTQIKCFSYHTGLVDVISDFRII